MKIAQVNVYFNPFMVGGAEWYVYNISRRLVQRGHDVHVFTSNKYQKQTAPANEVIEGITVHRIPLKLDMSYRLKIWDGLADSIKREHFDVIHTYDYGQPHTRIALKVGREEDIPTLITVFDIHTMIPRPWYKQIPIRLFERYSAGGVFRSANRILVRAPPLVTPLERMGAPQNRITVTPSGINEESLGKFEGDLFLRDHGVSGSPVILFLGRLNPLKGPQHLLAAAPDILKEFPRAVFVFIGPEQSGYTKVLRGIANSSGVEKNVFFVGPEYDFTRKMQAYAACDVFVMPTTYEGTSQAIFEAMSQGKPIVATSVGGIPFQIENGREGILVPYGDDRALKQAVVRVLRDKTLAEALGSSARRKVESFTYPVLASGIEKIYEEVVRS